MNLNYDEEWKKHEHERRLNFEYNFYLSKRKIHRDKWILENVKSSTEPDGRDLRKLLSEEYNEKFPIPKRFLNIR